MFKHLEIKKLFKNYKIKNYKNSLTLRIPRFLSLAKH